MTSHLSISLAPGQTGGFKASSSASSSQNDAGGIDRAFANLLESATGGSADRGQSSESQVEAAISGVADVALSAKTADEGNENLAEKLVDLLAQLDAAQKAGEEPSKDLLDQLNDLAEAMAGALGINLDAKLADPSATPSLLEQLASKISSMTDGMDAEAGGLADKLKALAQSLANTPLDADALAKLGFDADAGADIKAAIEALVGPKPAKEPVLATPSLDVPETSALSAKSTTTTTEQAGGFTASEPTADTAKTAIGTDTDTPKDAKPDTNTKAKAEIIAAKVDDVAGTQTDASEVGLPQNAARTELASTAKPLPTPYASVQSQLNVPGIAFEIARQVQAGTSRFEIRLDPPELGRIDVKLDVDRLGNVHAKLTVERAETLDMMMRDQRTLEKALQQAGLDGSKTNLEFSLKQNPSGRQDQQADGGGSLFGGSGSDGSDGDDVAQARPVTLYRGTVSAGGVNIFV